MLIVNNDGWKHLTWLSCMPTGSWSNKGRINDCKYTKIIKVNCGPAPSWLVSSFGRALHRYHRGHRLKSRTCLNFFHALLPLLPSVIISCNQFITAKIAFKFISLQKWILYFSYIYSQNKKDVNKLVKNCDKDIQIGQKKASLILIITVVNTPWIHDRCCLEMTPDHLGVQNV